MDCPSSADFQSLTKDDNTIIMAPYGSICVTRGLSFYPLPKYTERMKRLISNMHACPAHTNDKAQCQDTDADIGIGIMFLVIGNNTWNRWSKAKRT